MITGPLSDIAPGWHYTFVITHCAWAGSQLALFAVSRRREAGGPAAAKTPKPLLLIPPALVLAMMSTYAGLGTYVPAPPTLALSASLALIWSGVALQVWTLRRQIAARAIASDEARRRLLATGPWRISRNPAETGGYITLIGIALGFGTGLAIAIISIVGALGFGIILTDRAPLQMAPSSGSRWRFIPFIW